MSVPWQVALGAVAIAGLIFILTAGIGLRERLITAIPESLKHAIGGRASACSSRSSASSGAASSSASPGTLVTLGHLKSPPALLTLFGLLAMAVLMARRVHGALLIGILASTVVGAGDRARALSGARQPRRRRSRRRSCSSTSPGALHARR